MRVPIGAELVAEKYRAELPGVRGRIEYKDAILEEPDIVLVKTREFHPALTGYLAWRFKLKPGKRGAKAKPGEGFYKGEAVTNGEPKPHEFLAWARQQSRADLRDLLREQGIVVTGTAHLPLAWRLTGLYEDKWRERHELPHSLPVETRVRRAYALDYGLTLTGVRDEAIAVRVNAYVRDGNTAALTKPFTGEKDMAARRDTAEESPSDIRRRLESQAEETDSVKEAESSDVNGKKTGRSKDKAGKGDAEMDAIRRGKSTDTTKEPEKKPANTESKGDTKEEKKRTSAKGKSAAQSTPTNDTPAADTKTRAGDKETDVPTATARKSSKKGRTSGKSARPHGPIKRSGNTQKDMPEGSKVKYVGTRNEQLIGKTAEVLGPRNKDGVWLKLSDGTRASAMCDMLEVVSKGKK